jgi:hypothetical protein
VADRQEGSSTRQATITETLALPSGAATLATLHHVTPTLRNAAPTSGSPAPASTVLASAAGEGDAAWDMLITWAHVGQADVESQPVAGALSWEAEGSRITSVATASGSAFDLVAGVDAYLFVVCLGIAHTLIFVPGACYVPFFPRGQAYTHKAMHVQRPWRACTVCAMWTPFPRILS